MGGTYVLVFYLGMLISKHNVLHIFSDISFKKISVITAVSLALMLIWGRFYYTDLLLLDSKLPFGTGKNPPSITLILWSLIILFLCYGFFNLLEKTNVLNVITCICSFLGKHTLYIFLFHQFFLNNVCVYLPFSSIWLKRIVYFAVMIVGSIIIEYIAKFLKKAILSDSIKQNYKEVQSVN